MNFIKTKLEDAFIIEPNIFKDDRGYFFESYNKRQLNEYLGYDLKFCQDNESFGTYGTLRGLHFQDMPYTQTKLVRVIKGKVLDVIVDLRSNSKTYMEHTSVELSDTNKRQLFVPQGFAHGFIVLSSEAIFAYKVDNYYSSDHDNGIFALDSELNIDWKIKQTAITMSKKDINHPLLKDAKFKFYR